MQSPVASLSPFPSARSRLSARPRLPQPTCVSPLPQSAGFHSPAVKSSVLTAPQAGHLPSNQRNTSVPRPSLRRPLLDSSQWEPHTGSESFSCTSSSHKPMSSLSGVIGLDSGKTDGTDVPFHSLQREEAAQGPRPPDTPSPDGARSLLGCPWKCQVGRVIASGRGLGRAGSCQPEAGRTEEEKTGLGLVFPTLCLTPRTSPTGHRGEGVTRAVESPPV